MIYLVEDDDSIRSFVIYALNSQGMEAQGFARRQISGRRWSSAFPTWCCSTSCFPRKTGCTSSSACATPPPQPRLPVMMLTAKGSEFDRVVGLDAGADDYLPKPFGIMELLARIRALLRRTGEEQAPMTYTVGELVVCPSKHLVEVGGKPVSLSLKEFELLCALLQERGTVLTRAQLLDRIWGYEFDGETRTVTSTSARFGKSWAPAGIC